MGKMSLRASGGPSRYPPPVPALRLQNCPINASLGTLGRKWTLTILRDIAFYPGTGFSAILKTNPGIMPRILSLRLRQLGEEGLISKSSLEAGSRHRGYELTAKGRDVWPILAGLVQFGVRNHPSHVFADGQPRNIEEVFPGSSPVMLGPLAEFARQGGPGQVEPAVSRAGATGRRNGQR